MTTEDLLRTFPGKRVNPVDGTAITAQVWEEAHAHHRERRRLHTLFNHGPGIVTGLEVIASDPPDRTVYILPGVAIDSIGQTIVLPEPVAYDFGDEIEGFLYLFLSYDQSRPRADRGHSEPEDPLYVHHQFSIVARPTIPSTPVVELARGTRESRDSILIDAQDPMFPGINEIDVRFRREIGAGVADLATIGGVYLGDGDEKVQGRGAAYLARALNRMPGFHVVVDDNVPLAPGVQNYTMIYLVGEGKFELNRSQVRGLQGYVARNGTLFVESNDSAAASAFGGYFKEMEAELGALTSDSALTSDPFLFAQPPAGYETEGSPSVQVGEGVVFSTHGYGRMWLGEQRERAPSRHYIRAAVEWGTNLVTYAVNRRQQLSSR